jgi:hypothetical protein
MQIAESRIAPAALTAMLRCEQAAGIKATYSVVGCFLDEVRPEIEQEAVIAWRFIPSTTSSADTGASLDIILASGGNWPGGRASARKRSVSISSVGAGWGTGECAGFARPNRALPRNGTTSTSSTETSNGAASHRESSEACRLCAIIW